MVSQTHLAPRVKAQVTGWRGGCMALKSMGPARQRLFTMSLNCARNIFAVRDPRLKMPHARLSALAAFCLFLMLAVHVPASAQGSQLEISMDELVEDSWSNLIVARGNVEIRFYGEILLADEVAYDRSANKLTAR